VLLASSIAFISGWALVGEGADVVAALVAALVVFVVGGTVDVEVAWVCGTGVVVVTGEVDAVS